MQGQEKPFRIDVDTLVNISGLTEEEIKRILDRSSGIGSIDDVRKSADSLYGIFKTFKTIVKKKVSEDPATRKQILDIKSPGELEEIYKSWANEV
jgi:hypothetical protein